MLVVLNSKFYHSFARFIFLAVNLIAGVCGFESVYAASVTTIEPVQACVFASTAPLSTAVRAQIADCLGWQQDDAQPFCRGSYKTTNIPLLANPNEVQIQADSASFYPTGRSTLQGHVSVHQTARVVNAQTAYVYRDGKTNQVTQIELLNRVRYVEPGKLMLAKQANINPQDKSGRI